MHNDMEQKITKFLAQVGIIRALDGVYDFVTLLDKHGPEGGVRLLAIPGTTIRGAEAGDNFLQAGDTV
jgi:hypothetical protein